MNAILFLMSFSGNLKKYVVINPYNVDDYGNNKNYGK